MELSPTFDLIGVHYFDDVMDGDELVSTSFDDVHLDDGIPSSKEIYAT